MEPNRTQKKRGLEICATAKLRCKDCTIPPCLEKHLENALSLIKELTEENERLSNDKEYWKNRARESESEYAQAVKRGYNLGTVDSVRAFDERAKAKVYTNNYCQEVVLLSDIDQIAKEMLEGENQ
jgi:hypothetical protein